MIDQLWKGVVARVYGMPKEADGSEKALRLGQEGALYGLPLTNGAHMLADEGSYFIGQNPTPGTGIAFAVTAALSDTAGVLLAIKNNEQPSQNARRVYLDFIRLILTAVPASATAGELQLKIDNVNRFTSGGTQLVLANANMDENRGPVSQAWFGALTTTGVGPSVRLAGRSKLRTAIPVIGDEWIIKFGTIEAAGAAALLNGTNATRYTIPHAPVVLGPQQFLLVQPWFPGNAATPASFEVELGLFER